jgi:hypothetical protein
MMKPTGISMSFPRKRESSSFNTLSPYGYPDLGWCELSEIILVDNPIVNRHYSIVNLILYSGRTYANN